MAAASSTSISDEVAALLQLRDATNFSGWGRKGGWGDLEAHKDPRMCDRVDVENGHVTKIRLWNNSLQGTLPDVFTAFTHLQVLQFHNEPGFASYPNDLTGVLPMRFPASLHYLDVSGNPNLAGVISKELILQCNAIDYSNCKKAWNPDTGEKNKEYMQGPFIVGASFASENIGNLLYMREELNISAGMLRDVPKKGDPAMEMTKTHGDRWVAWQEVWLNGLKTLNDQKVYVMSLGQHYFEQKFKDRTSAEKNAKNCFDPTYALPVGEKASSILDWERRQILAVARTNNLTIEHLDANENFSYQSGQAPSWYQAMTEQESPAVNEQDISAVDEHAGKQCCVSQ